MDIRENFVDETLSATIEAELESLNLKNRRCRGPSTVWLTSNNANGASNAAIDIKNYTGISNLMKKMNDSEFTDKNYQLDSCLISCLATAKKTVSLHSNNKKEHICLNIPICVVSFEAERTIEFTHLDNKLVKTYTPKNGGLYIMKEGSQSFLKHRVPAGQHIVNGNNVRYSLSFRRFLGNKATLDGRAIAASSTVTSTSYTSYNRNTHWLRAVVF